MALPKLTTPTYELEVPSSDEKIQYRPFLVKEEKMLMMAMESGENKDMVRALRDIMISCLEDDIDIDKLPMFDVEYIFLQLRSSSVGEMTPITYSLDDDICKKNKNANCSYSVEVNLNDIKVEKQKDHTDHISLTDDIKLKMIYPKMFIL